MKGRTIVRVTAAALAAAFSLPGCSSSTNSAQTDPNTEVRSTTVPATMNGNTTTGHESTLTAQVWADNWFALYVNGTKVGEDSVPFPTERSFNSERITFTATYPLTIAMVTRDFMQDDSGLEYVGTDRQQMGDGGFIAQFTDSATGKVVATTGPGWRGLVVHRAPLDTSCEKSVSPSTDCESSINAEPADWTAQEFDDSGWVTATTYTEQEVGVKDGYLDVKWSPSARLIWTSSLTQDNTILWRHTVDR